MTDKRVAVLFARRDSIYKRYPHCDVYDVDRDARTYGGDLPIIAHPPCRAWGALRRFAKPAPGEKELAIWAIDRIRSNGGVLEHPRASSLWPALGLPTGRDVDQWGGFTLDVNQSWWGHLAQKRSFFYVCGCLRRDVPTIPLSLSLPKKVVATSRSRKGSSGVHLPKSLREVTPPHMAEWLISLALAISERRADGEAA